MMMRRRSKIRRRKRGWRRSWKVAAKGEGGREGDKSLQVEKVGACWHLESSRSCWSMYGMIREEGNMGTGLSVQGTEEQKDENLSGIAVWLRTPLPGLDAFSSASRLLFRDFPPAANQDVKGPHHWARYPSARELPLPCSP